MQEKHLSMAYIFHSGGLVDNITLFLNQKLNCAILISPVDRYYTSLSPGKSFLGAGKSKN